MNKCEILKELRRLYQESESFQGDDVQITEWISAVDPLLESINAHYYLVSFRAAASSKFYDLNSKKYKYHIQKMREFLLMGIKKLELETYSQQQNTEQQYFIDNSPFDIQTKIANIIQTVTVSIWIADAYMDDKILNELIMLKCSDIILLTKNNPQLFRQRVEAFVKQNPEIKIKVGISNKLHDRFYIIDKQKAWTLGASYKDAGTKPTILTPVTTENLKKLILDFESWWDSSEKIIS